MKANRECGLDVSRRPSHSDGRFIQPIRIGFGQYHRPFRRIMGRFSQEHHFGVQGEQMVRCLAKPDPGLARSDGHIKLRIGNAFVKFHQINNLIIAVTMRLCLLYRGGTPAGGTNEYLAFAVAVTVQQGGLCGVCQIADSWNPASAAALLAQMP
jgi:hypothetical protein